jgi:hypothetical protein
VRLGCAIPVHVHTEGRHHDRQRDQDRTQATPAGQDSHRCRAASRSRPGRPDELGG